MHTGLKRRLDLIEDEARKTFGDDYSRRWLKSPSRYFQGKAPIHCARQPDEAERVLRHIRHFGTGNVY